MHRRLLRRAVLAVAVTAAPLTGTLPAPPAQASTLALSSIDTSVPGHASGSVTTDAPYVLVEIVDESGQTGTAVVEGPAGGTPYGFDLATWGSDHYVVQARACSTAALCTAGVTRSDSLQTDELPPSMTFPDDVTIGPGQAYVVSSHQDAAAGGELIAVFNGERSDLPSDGHPVAVPLSNNATGSVRIQRCLSDDPAAPCADVGGGPTITVLRDLAVRLRALLPDGHPDGTTANDLVVTLSTVLNHPTDVTWSLTDPSGTPVPGFASSQQAVAMPFTGGYDLTGLADGTYSLTASLSAEDPDYGQLAGQATTPVVIDATSTGVRTILDGPTKLYPYPDSYNDTFRYRVTTNEIARMGVTVLDSTGSVVRRQALGRYEQRHQFYWSGVNAQGKRVPAGHYTVVATFSDLHKNQTVERTPILVSDLAKLKVAQKVHFTARDTLLDTWAGSCSRATKLGRNGVSLLSDVTCAGGDNWKKTGVAAVFGVTLPKVLRYYSLSVAVDGGPHQDDSSQALCELWRPDAHRWALPRILDASPTIPHPCHSLRFDKVKPYVGSKRDFTWRVSTGYANRYDVRAFDVRVSYLGWVAPNNYRSATPAVRTVAHTIRPRNGTDAAGPKRSTTALQ